MKGSGPRPRTGHDARGSPRVESHASNAARGRGPDGSARWPEAGGRRRIGAVGQRTRAPPSASVRNSARCTARTRDFRRRSPVRS
ncbi:hypothetical protein ABIA38_004930 [Embleya sp. AB8]